MLSRKKKLDDASIMKLAKECLVFFVNKEKLPQNLNDPWSFSIPFVISSLSFDNALADLGAGINVMPYKIFQKARSRRTKT